MLNCCNRDFYGIFSRVLNNNADFYRRIEFGICPNCGNYRFLDFRLINGVPKKKFLSGKEAENAFDKLYKKTYIEKSGTKSGHNFYYGDFRRTGKTDSNGNPVYLQLRKNFNNVTEILGEVSTKVIKIS